MLSAQFLRFGVAGAIGFVVDSLVLLAVTQGLGVQPLPWQGDLVPRGAHHHLADQPRLGFPSGSGA